MQIRFLLGPAGSGKSSRCLAEIRGALNAAPDGLPLVLLTPKQQTYHFERQLLSHPAIPGYTRLHILSFERLAQFVFEQSLSRPPSMLDEEGRLMVLRGLLARKRDKLRLFRASARLTGFARQLSEVLRELQRHQLTPQSLLTLAEKVTDSTGLAYKLQDLAALLQHYLDWLSDRDLHDVDSLLGAAAGLLAEKQGLRLAHVWVDGFVEFSDQELGLLAALVPCCGGATLTLCLDRSQTATWLSNWSIANHTFESCRKKLGEVSGAELIVEPLPRVPALSRFPHSPVLAHLEQSWAEPKPYGPSEKEPDARQAAELERALRVVECAEPQAEATIAAREILSYVQAGGRYRDVAVLVRQLDPYHLALQRVFTRFQIPFFLDRRESVAHHPLAELSRSALRTIASNWLHEDWFAALKSGLLPAEDVEIDRLENEALARGWRGAAWQKPIIVPDDAELTQWLADLHARLLPPFQKLALSLALCANKPTGRQLAAALRALWQALRIETRLQEWAEIDHASPGLPVSVHATVWDQMNHWLENLELAFPDETLSLREWLPILEAGLANLTVGVIPPALDQVLIGSIDRSRNPDVNLALVLGMNETLFPAPPQSSALLTEADRVEIEKQNIVLGASARRQLSREQYYAYLACTRARQRVVLTCALQDARGKPLNPSPFLFQLRQLFPALNIEHVPAAPDWRAAQHPVELIGPLLKQGLPAEERAGNRQPQQARALSQLPQFTTLLEQLRHLRNPSPVEALAPELAVKLYGPVLRTSVSRMEQFAACPFKFFVHSGLRAEERKQFELDLKEQGSFQHDVLALFHRELRAEGKHWRDLAPEEARRRVARLAKGLMTSYRDGLLEASEETRFMARILSESLQDFVETLVGWMRQQYRFEPVEVELPFGDSEGAPPWTLVLGDGHRLELYGRIDRVDLFRQAGSNDALCVVVDYKSSHKQLDAVLLNHGLQLQLLAYLNVLRHWPNPRAVFAADRLVPAGVFYVNLRGRYDRQENRDDALAKTEDARRRAYLHHGRFDARMLPLLDSRPDAQTGDQFSYRLTKAGQVYRSSREAIDSPQFSALLDSIELNLKEMGRRVYAGIAEVAPFRKGIQTACEQCSYQAICRLDPWTQRYRILGREQAGAPASTEPSLTAE